MTASSPPSATRSSGTLRPGMVVLDVAPQVHAGVRPMLAEGVILETLDLDPAAGATYTADLVRTQRQHSVGAVRVRPLYRSARAHAAAVRRGARAAAHPGSRWRARAHDAVQLPHPRPAAGLLAVHGARAAGSARRLRDRRPRPSCETPDRPLMPVHYRTGRAPPGLTKVRRPPAPMTGAWPPRPRARRIARLRSPSRWSRSSGPSRRRRRRSWPTTSALARRPASTPTAARTPGC